MAASSTPANSKLIERKTLDIKVSDYPNKIDFYVVGGNWSDYLYPILNYTNQYDLVKLVPEPNNRFDQNAIKVECNGYLIGYVPAYFTAEVQDVLFKENIAYVSEITKGSNISIKIVIGYK